jgi:hypothetical protein
LGVTTHRSFGGFWIGWWQSAAVHASQLLVPPTSLPMLTFLFSPYF